MNKRGQVKPESVLTLNDDFALIRSFNEGDELAFRTLVNRHKEKVRNLVFLTLGNTDQIDDITQEVFISVYRHLKEFRYESRFTTWLYRITVNKCRDSIRRAKIRSIFSPFSDDEDPTLSVSHDDNSDVSQIVRNAVSKLPEKLRIPLVLKDFEGLSYQEIAEALGGVEMGTVKSRIFRARETLRKSLEPLRKELI
ncbi:MAG: sigma-70 family RNA polymerase sigma factor [Ignavibacteriales bacterium]|nr:MAG: sigma-70 family RNA polymerase sigma factor [Ignavibacteriales bacterium]